MYQELHRYAMTPLVNMIVQTLAGLVIVYVIYVLALLAMRADKMIIDEMHDQAIKREVTIISGSISAGENASVGGFNSWNTTLPFSPNFMPIRPSVNTKGGAQFTYSFWLYVGLPEDAIGKTILIKGDKETYSYTLQERRMDLKDKTMKPHGPKLDKRDRVVMCPMISFGDAEMEFVITFNTFHNMHEKMHIRKIKDDNNMLRNNLTSLFPRQWMRITVVFEDNVPINDFEDGIRVRFYVGDILYSSGTFASALRQNRGDLFIFPDDVTIKDCKIADVKYFNYALSDDAIRKFGLQKPNLQSAATSSTTTVANLGLSDYNRLDIYNS